MTTSAVRAQSGQPSGRPSGQSSGQSSGRARVRRDQLLDELIEVFLAEGFASFSVGELAARLRCSKTTLYVVASSKEQIVLAAVRSFFRRAADRIEARVAAAGDPGSRLEVYLRAVAEELEPASSLFYADLVGFAPASGIYQDNTRYAARRVRELVAAGVESGSMRPVDAVFVGAAVAQVMAAIQDGAIGAATGLDDADAYRALADLVVHALAPVGR